MSGSNQSQSTLSDSSPETSTPSEPSVGNKSAKQRARSTSSTGASGYSRSSAHYESKFRFSHPQRQSLIEPSSSRPPTRQREAPPDLHGPTNLPPTPYASRSSPLTPKPVRKHASSLPPEQLNPLLTRMDRIERAVNEYVDYRGKGALQRSRLPQTASNTSGGSGKKSDPEPEAAGSDGASGSKKMINTSDK